MVTVGGIVRRARWGCTHPADVGFALRIGWFIWRCPGDIERTDVTAYLASLQTAPRPQATDVFTSRTRIVRLRDAWLRLPRLRRRNTCYVRAFTLYRFVDAGTRDVRIHFGVEPDRSDRLRGHAWVTVDGEMLEGPPEVTTGSIVEVNLGAR
jgi:hypothetical protein